jgi:NAD(P)-dependent dehydrogenase (short-subunit alcohol dehydrogenase family)
LAKSALEGLMRNLAVDYGRYGITANTIRPGIIRTERTAKVMSNPKYEIRVGRMIPSGVVGEPDQVAEVVELLLSKTSYINGQALNVGGGLPLVSMMKM